MKKPHYPPRDPIFKNTHGCIFTDTSGSNPLDNKSQTVGEKQRAGGKQEPKDFRTFTIMSMCFAFITTNIILYLNFTSLI